MGMIMKRIGGILCIIILLIMGLTVAPVMSSVIEANTADSNMQVKKAEEIVTLDFYDYTGFRPVKQRLSYRKMIGIIFELNFNK